MAIAFTCSCGKALSVSETLAGSKTRCSGCGNLIPVPKESAPGMSVPANRDPAYYTPPVVRKKGGFDGAAWIVRGILGVIGLLALGFVGFLIWASTHDGSPAARRPDVLNPDRPVEEQLKDAVTFAPKFFNGSTGQDLRAFISEGVQRLEISVSCPRIHFSTSAPTQPWTVSVTLEGGTGTKHAQSIVIRGYAEDLKKARHVNSVMIVNSIH